MIKATKFSRYGDLNSHDILKVTAVFAMIIGHFGHFFYPDDLNYRVVGRAAVPIFLFLVGYSLNYTFNPKVLFIAIAVTATDIIFHHPVLTLNILYTICLWRFFMLKMNKDDYIDKNLLFLFPLALIMAFPTFLVLDANSIALLFIICGYLSRNNIKHTRAKIFFFLTFLAHTLATLASYEFNAIQMIVVCLLLAGLFYFFFIYEFKKLLHITSPLAINTIKFTSRYSLYIYGAHLILFKITATLLFPEEYYQFIWFANEAIFE